MKRVVLAILLVAATFITSYSQNLYDALRFSLRYYDGTARSLGMGNAMMAFGGDMGALSYNPAASGPYRYSEATVTPGIYTNLNHTSYLGETHSANRSRFFLSNIGWTGGFETGRTRGFMGMNFSIAANQTNNYAFRSSASGTEAESSFLGYLASNIPNTVSGDDIFMSDNQDDPRNPFYNTDLPWDAILGWNIGMIDEWQNPADTKNHYYAGATENITSGGPVTGGPLNQRYFHETTGYSQDIIFNASGNISDLFFFGVNVTVQNLWFNEYLSYSEDAVDPSDFQTGFTSFTSEFARTTSGLGVGIAGGFIVRPVAGLSIGGSISTPTWTALTDTWISSMKGHTATYGSCNADSPPGQYRYRITSPFKWSLGVGYTFSNRAAIGVDYESTDYSSIVMADINNNNRDEFNADNRAIAATFKRVHNLRVGGEFRIIPELALRAGYNYYDSSIKGFDNSRHYASLGLGYRSMGGFFIDIAYQQQCNFNEESFSLYEDYRDVIAPIMTEKYLNWKLLLTIGCRF